MPRHLRQSLLWIGLMLSSGSGALAQDTLLYWPKVELGMNITQTLAGFFNAGSQGTPTDPYLFSLKFPGSNQVFRTGMNVRLRNREEQENLGQRLIAERALNLRAGIEWRKRLNTQFSLYYGLDGIWAHEVERVDFNTAGGKIQLGNQQTSWGAGPVLGLMFHLGTKILLSTEASLYWALSTGTEKEQTDPTVPPQEQRVRQFELIPAIPNSLYLFFRF